MATSSSDLKTSKRKRKFPKDSVVTRLKQASERAVAARKKDALFQHSPVKEEGTLTQLMQAIDEQLATSQDSILGLNRPSHPARDSMTALMMHNDRVHNSYVNPPGSLTRTIAIVLCKPLIDGHISIEQTVRIQRLITALQDEELQPYMMCFVGSDGSTISMEYFQTKLHELDMPNTMKCMAETTSIPDGGLDIIADYVRNDVERLAERLKHRRATLHLEFALISSEYHLCVLNDIHVRSPSQSFLQGLDHWEVEQGPAFRPPKLTVTTAWTYLYASTVDLRYKNHHRDQDDTWLFASACFRRAQQLIPVLMNLRAVCANREFFQRDNYRLLVQVRRSFITDIEGLYRDKIAFAPVRRHLTNTGKPLDIVLEEALLSMGRCSDLVRPAGMLTGSVPAHDFHLSVTVLEHAITQITLACDPDQPLSSD